VEVALPHQPLADIAVAHDLLSAHSVVYTAATGAPTSFDRAIMDHFGCRLQVLQEPWSTLYQQIQRAMQTFGQRHVDLLRLSIDGAEYEVLDMLPQVALRPGQLVVDFHHHLPPNTIAHTERALQQLHAIGYRIYARGQNGRSYSLVLM
jgi:hypothetical protein